MACPSGVSPLLLVSWEVAPRCERRSLAACVGVVFWGGLGDGRLGLRGGSLFVEKTEGERQKKT